MTVNFANRGQVFENLIDYTNRIYKNKGIALINKRPTPIKVLRMQGRRITAAVHDQKSTVDYDGIYKGNAIVFEAKSTKLPRLPLDMIQDHQVRYLKQAEEQGAVAFVIVDLREVDKTYVVPNSLLLEYVENVKSGGRKSIPMGDIKERGIEVAPGNGIPLDYLKAVDRLVKGVRK